MFKMSGYYDITNVKQVTYKNGNLIKEEVESQIGTILFRKADTKAESSVDYDLSYTLDLKAWDEISEPGFLGWDASVNNQVVDLILEPDNAFSAKKSLTFTITKQNSASKELLYTHINQDSIQNRIVTHEFYTLNLR